MTVPFEGGVYPGVLHKVVIRGELHKVAICKCMKTKESDSGVGCGEVSRVRAGGPGGSGRGEEDRALVRGDDAAPKVTVHVSRSRA